MTIEIISDPEIMGGRYCFKGTRMPAGQVVSMVATSDVAWVLRNYQHIPLTQAHIDAALAFDFNPIGDAEVSVDSVSCSCGEEAWPYAVNPLEWHCPVCKRVWRVSLSERAA